MNAEKLYKKSSFSQVQSKKKCRLDFKDNRPLGIAQMKLKNVVQMASYQGGGNYDYTGSFYNKHLSNKGGDDLKNETDSRYGEYGPPLTVVNQVSLENSLASPSKFIDLNNNAPNIIELLINDIEGYFIKNDDAATKPVKNVWCYLEPGTGQPQSPDLFFHMDNCS